MKALKWIIAIVLVLFVAGYFGFDYIKEQTKKHSPQETVNYTAGEFSMSVTYSRPYKKGREIFGDLVPYEKVWRTGANEPTIFECNQTVTIGDQDLPAGTYTLWTIPYSSQWTVIWNSKLYDWGVGFDGEPSRDPDYDVLKINVPTSDTKSTVEQFTIDFQYHVNMRMAWDNAQVMVPMMYGYN